MTAREMKSVDTVVIGAGQAGLAISYYLAQAGREHVILEKECTINAWRDERWDSFSLAIPNWTLALPDMPYDGDDPEGFLARQEVIDYLERFAALFDPPVLEGVEATAVEAAPSSNDLIVRTSAGDYRAANVVVAAGMFPGIPAFSERLARDVKQMHSSQYRNPDQLPPGTVLVVGSGQSGAQIAEELFEHGHRVYLANGRAGRLPRRYRAAETARWLWRTGMAHRTADQLPSPAARFFFQRSRLRQRWRPHDQRAPLQQGRDDAAGHLRDGQRNRLEIAPDLKENLASADQVAREFKQGVDAFIEREGLEAPEEDEPELRDGYHSPVVTELDLQLAGISTIVWATGYSFDFSWVKFPIFDEFGHPVQERGVTPQPGLYFLGLPWLHTIKSGLLAGVAEDAAHVAAHIESHRPETG